MAKLHRFCRLEKVIGEESLKLLNTKTVLIIGCGGVGGYVIESLARSNIGHLILVDYDKVEETNINRQLIALDSTIGKIKVDVWENRIKEINPECKITTIKEFINKDNIELLFQEKIDYLVDACDTIETKKGIIKECLNRNIPFISSMGTGNKMDPSQLEIIDLRKTKNDPLARILRKYIKDEKINKKIMVLSSKEVPVKIKDRTPGSTAFVPPAAGLLIGSYIVKEFIKK